MRLRNRLRSLNVVMVVMAFEQVFLIILLLFRGGVTYDVVVAKRLFNVVLIYCNLIQVI